MQDSLSSGMHPNTSFLSDEHESRGIPTAMRHDDVDFGALPAPLSSEQRTELAAIYAEYELVKTGPNTYTVHTHRKNVCICENDKGVDKAQFICSAPGCRFDTGLHLVDTSIDNFAAHVTLTENAAAVHEQRMSNASARGEA